MSEKSGTDTAHFRIAMQYIVFTLLKMLRDIGGVAPGPLQTTEMIKPKHNLGWCGHQLLDFPGLSSQVPAKKLAWAVLSGCGTTMSIATTMRHYCSPVPFHLRAEDLVLPFHSWTFGLIAIQHLHHFDLEGCADLHNANHIPQIAVRLAVDGRNSAIRGKSRPCTIS